MKFEDSSLSSVSQLSGTTTTTILTLKGAIAVLASEIAEHEADIAKNNEEMKRLTSIREKENSPRAGLPSRTMALVPRVPLPS